MLRIGGHYRLREITPRHFRKLAVAASYPAEALLAHLAEFSERIPDEAAGVLKEIAEQGMARAVLIKLVDSLTAKWGGNTLMLRRIARSRLSR